MEEAIIKSNRPEWVPKDGGNEFTTVVNPGKSVNHDGLPSKENTSIKKYKSVKRKQITTEEYYNGIMNRDKTILARAITLVESNSSKHFSMAQDLIKQILPKTGKSIRIGITGVPGAGKSTFIERFGLFLLDLGYKVAVLAVDPSSTVTKGSILGDKTRMEKLSREQDCFIRPSPAAGTLGGVNRKTRETMLMCEAFGYDVILVETVGVGQNEVTVRDMVDFFMLIQIAGAGDELQGIKKGVIEIADAIVVNKADGDNINRAKLAQGEYMTALHYIAPATPGWKTKAFTCSALNGTGLPEIWDVINKFKEVTSKSKVFDLRRREQIMTWVKSMINNHLISSFYNDKRIKAVMPSIQNQVLSGQLTPSNSVEKLLEIYEDKND